ncbi:flavodoxin domain-containing protein [Streptomyces sp. NPDC050504]|uniref:flavodoxin domain-containing protein n=1 Tax=Streptomyces sp. NPDC050504 TaxID=3365618 RepID=UPI0037979FAC
MNDRMPVAHRVLVAYGSKNGSTAEIAQAVAETLNEEGVTATARPAALVGDLDGYDAVVIGGALYTGRWHREARRFLRRHRSALSRLPVWLFSSGPLDASATARDIPAVRGVLRTAAHLGARGHVTFGGRLEQGAEGRVAHMILKSGKGGDFRDFPQIAAWARNIARELEQGEPPCAPRGS